MRLEELISLMQLATGRGVRMTPSRWGHLTADASRCLWCWRERTGWWEVPWWQLIQLEEIRAPEAEQELPRPIWSYDLLRTHHPSRHQTEPLWGHALMGWQTCSVWGRRGRPEPGQARVLSILRKAFRPTSHSRVGPSRHLDSMFHPILKLTIYKWNI